MITLYKNHKRSIGIYMIWTEGNEVVWEHATGIDGVRQQEREVILVGKQGRSIAEQAEFRMRSRVNSKLIAGYVTSIDEARATPTDKEGKVKPMLAQRLSDFKGELDPDNTYIQLKYNGHRCLLTKENGIVVAYSRNGKLIPGINHILTGFEMPDGIVLDGEIYHHGWPLQKIASLAKKAQPESGGLSYICYDLIMDEVFSRRFEIARPIIRENGAKSISLAVTRRLADIPPLTTIFNKAKASGYEGLMARLDNKPYETGRRSPSLLKIKSCIDDEFMVIDVIPSRLGVGILVCQLPNGVTFKTLAPGTELDKRFALLNKDKFIGRMVTVEYAELTQSGIPFHCVATGWRNDL